MKTKLLTIALFFFFNFSFAQTYSTGSDLIGGRPNGVYSIFGNTNNLNGSFIELWGNNSGRPGELTFVSGLGSSSPGITFHMKTADSYYNSTILHRSGTLEQISPSGRRTWIGAGDNAAISFIPNIGNSWFHIHHTHNNSLQISHGGSVGQFPLLTINNQGQMKVGTKTITSGSHTDYKLSVDGKLVAQDIYVISPSSTSDVWADYVFEKDYKLKSLEEVEKYISKNKHLPEVPTTAEVMENGINLGKMDALLLKKIEELTLHMIDIKKEVNTLKKENTELKKENNKIKSLLK